MIGAPKITSEPFWYPDFGASHHVTIDPRNLAMVAPYIGND